MMSGYQTRGINFWDHGTMVYLRFADLLNDVQHMNWVLPKWFSSNAGFIRRSLEPHLSKIRVYQQYHDCGKAYCQTFDTNDKPHYPDHANISADIYLSLGGDKEVADLIRDDMLCHNLRPAEALEFASNPNALILLVTGLCELHANASMFGGVSSDSFKIKFKRIERCGQIVLNELKKNL
jgi:hypothetical protein